MDRIKEVTELIEKKEKVKICLISKREYLGKFTNIFQTNKHGRTLAYFTDKNDWRISILVEDITEIIYGGGR